MNGMILRSTDAPTSATAVRWLLRQSVRGIMVLGSVMLGTTGPAFAQCTAVCVVIDGSGSINSTNFALMKSGFSAAMRDGTIVPRNSTVEMAFIQLGVGSGAQVEVPRTLITSDAVANNIATQLDAIAQGGGLTPMDAAINLCASTLAGACPGGTQVINIVTDGNPDSADAAVTARENAVSGGVDQVNAEAVAAPDSAFTFLRDRLVYPQPGYEAPPFQGSGGFVIKTATFADFANAVRAKLRQIVGPEPGKDCQIFPSTDVPKAIPDMGMARSTVNVTATGKPTSVSVVGLRGTHSFMEDLEIHLVGPLGTDVVVFEQACGDTPGFNFSLDDSASIMTPCPPDDGMRHKPSNPLSAFVGQNPSGQWTLDIFDRRPFDDGQLQGWGVEVCFAPPEPEPGCQSYNSTDPPLAIHDFTTVSSTINVTATGALTSVSIPNLHGTHTFMEDLEMHLVSPKGTDVLIFDQACGDSAGFDFGLDDLSLDADPCPPNDGMLHRPSNPFSTFVGEEASGAWTLRISDNRAFDEGELDRWTLRVCFGGTQCFTVSSADVPKVIPDMGTAHSELFAPFIDVLDPSLIFYRVHAQGQHSFFEDLRFVLTSPSNTSVLLTDRKCGDYSGPFNLSWDEAASSNDPCPPDPKLTRPEESFAGTINGELPGGTWTLEVADTRPFDDGTLDHWSLEICVGESGPTGTPTPTPTPTTTPQPCADAGSQGIGFGSSETTTIVSTVVLPPGLAFPPNACTYSIGTCIILGNTATWSATLPPRPQGETDGFSVLYVVEPGVPAGTKLCTSGGTSIDGRPPFPNAENCIIACGAKTPTPTPTPTLTATPTQTYTHVPTFTPTRTDTPAPTVTPTRTLTASLTPSGTRQPTLTPTRTLMPSLTPTATLTHTATHTQTPSVTPTLTRRTKPTFTPTSTPTETQTATLTPTDSATPTPSETLAPSMTPTVTVAASPTRTQTPSVTSTGTVPASATPTQTPSRTLTGTPTATLTRTVTATPTQTRRTKPTFTPTTTPTDTTTPTETPTGPTPTATLTPTGPTSTPTNTPSQTPTGATATPSVTPTGSTRTPTGSATMTPSGPTRTATATASTTATPTRTATGPTATVTRTATGGTVTPTRTSTATPTGGPGLGEPCATPGQCTSGFCTDGVCCETASCPLGQRCDIFGKEGRCSDPAGAGQACGNDLDCQAGFSCRFSPLRGQLLCTPAGGLCSCVGDCNCDGEVTIDELITMVGIALGDLNPVRCLMGDANLDGEITIDEIVTAVVNALNGCPAPPATPTPTATGAPLSGSSVPRRASGAAVALSRSLPSIPTMLSALTQLAGGGSGSGSGGGTIALQGNMTGQSTPWAPGA